MEKIVKVLAVGDPAVYGYVDKDYGIISKYENENNIGINFEIIPWNNYYDTMLKAFEGERDYDIVMVAGHLWLRDFVSKGYLSAVEVSKDPIYDREDILPVIRKEMELDGTQYLFPSFCDGHMVVYRKSVVKKVIGKLPDPVISTDQVIDMVSKCNGFNGMDGIALKAHASEIFLDFLPYLRNEGTDAFDFKSQEPSFNNLMGMKALEKYIKLKSWAPHDTGTYGNDEIKDAIQNKKSVFAVTWGGQLGAVMNDACMEKEDIGFAALRTSWNVTWSFGINQCSQKKQEAKDFLQYLSSKEIDRIIGGYAGGPVRHSTYILDENKYPWYPVHLEMIEKYAKPLPNMEHGGEKLGILYEAINEAFNEKISPEEALTKAHKEIGRRIGQ